MKRQRSPGHAARTPLLPGLVVAAHGRRVRVADEEGSCLCTVRRRLRVVTGDRVGWQRLPDGGGVVETREPRRSELARIDERGRRLVLAANVDVMLVVAAPVPLISDVELDAYLVAAGHLGLEAEVVYNKADLLGERQIRDARSRLARYEAAGYACSLVSAEHHAGIIPLQERLGARTSVLVGPSGVGKSSLTRALAPESSAGVGALSSGRGTHTTSASRMYRLTGGGAVIDSPGIRELGLGRIPPHLIAQAFPELRALAGTCRFRDCLHRGEPGCAVPAALDAGRIGAERLESYRTLLRQHAAPAPQRTPSPD